MYDVIIIGGSYAGLSAAMALGRSMRNTLIIDSGLPCNRFTPHSHNFITHDGATPGAVRDAALQQVLAYPTVQIDTDTVIEATKKAEGFEVRTLLGQTHVAKRLLFATGVRDVLPDIPGVKECWGKTLIHCPYCHGYEVRKQPTAAIVNNEHTYEFANMLNHWAGGLTICTDGVQLPQDVTDKLLAKNISVIETGIASLQQEDGQLQAIAFKDGTELKVAVAYAQFPRQQHCKLPEAMGCEHNEMGLIKADMMGRTTVDGVYAAGDAANMFRALSVAIASGTSAGAMLNKQLIEEGL